MNFVWDLQSHAYLKGFLAWKVGIYWIRGPPFSKNP